MSRRADPNRIKPIQLNIRISDADVHLRIRSVLERYKTFPGGKSMSKNDWLTRAIYEKLQRDENDQTTSDLL